MVWTANNPEEQNLLTEAQAVVFGNPAVKAAALHLRAAAPSLTLPQAISSTRLGSILDFSITLWNQNKL